MHGAGTRENPDSAIKAIQERLDTAGLYLTLILINISNGFANWRLTLWSIVNYQYTIFHWPYLKISYLLGVFLAAINSAYSSGARICRISIKLPLS